MSATLIAANAAKLPAGYCRVLQVLDNHARGNQNSDAWPCQARIARLAQLSVRHVRRILAELSELGIIRRTGDMPTRRGGRPITIWRICLDRLRALAIPIGHGSPDEAKTNRKKKEKRSLRSHGIQKAPRTATTAGWNAALARMGGSWETLMALGDEAERLATRLSRGP